MMKYNKVYPSFYNGISQQIPEFMLDSQCQDMINCIPDLIEGVSKRPPAKHVTHDSSLTNSAKIIHVYDRGEDDEEYIFVGTGDSANPIKIFNKAGLEKIVNYDLTNGDVKAYLTPTTISSLKGITVQDRTFMINKEKEVGIGTIAASSVNEAFYWLSRGSGDKYNPYRYAVYLDGTLFQTEPTIPATDNTTPPVGHEQADVACQALLVLINADTTTHGFFAEHKGTTLRITKLGGIDFDFSYWDSWGSQASIGWKDSISKLSDLPQELGWVDKVVEITGDDNNQFTDYFVISKSSSWLETKSPLDDRGEFTNMPIAIDRQADGSFLASQLTWDTPKVGDKDTNPTPSFVGDTLNDIFFYKNRLGIASEESVLLSEIGGYYNFYIKTVLDILDADPIDIALASSKASKIQYVKPFQSSLFIFTKDGQFELVSQGALSPTSVSLEPISSFPIAVEVEPVVNGNSLFFMSITNNRQQLREYIKNEDTLTVSGVDLNITTPTLIKDPAKKILINGVLGYVFITTTKNEIYLYNYKENSADRLQSAWSRWLFYESKVDIEADSFEYDILDDTLIIAYKANGDYIYSNIELTKDSSIVTLGAPVYPSLTLYPSDTLYPGGETFVDTDATTVYSYKAEIKLPKWFPHLPNSELGTPKDKILVKKVTIEGNGQFDARVYRTDYGTTYTKTHEYTTIQDLDLHVNSKVDNCEIYISDETSADFTIRSFIVEGLFSPTSKQLR